MEWREGVVESELSSNSSTGRYAVRLGDSAEPIRALAYFDVVGVPRPGDRVLLNVTALRQGLGTGGLAFVVAIPDRLPAGRLPGGHLVKARYTPQQQTFLTIDEQDSPHHEVLTSGAAADGDLLGMPVVVADLHSALPAILAGLRLREDPGRVGYLMTDGGALPLAFSDTVRGLKEAGWLTATITVGQAFGGDYEAVTLHSGLLAAKHALGLDAAVVIQGPGNAGTGTPWGFSGVAAGEAVTAVSTLNGHAVAALRVSAKDGRDRHRGLSHHSSTAYGVVALGRFDLPIPQQRSDFDEAVGCEVAALAAQARGDAQLVEVDTAGIDEALSRSPVALRTMGRGLQDDPAAFRWSAVAGRRVAMLLDSPRNS